MNSSKKGILNFEEGASPQDSVASFGTFSDNKLPKHFQKLGGNNFFFENKEEKIIAQRNYTIQSLIGKGSFGAVYKVINN